MKSLPYTPLTGAEISALRAALPAIVAWLRAREGTVGFQPAPEK